MNKMNKLITLSIISLIFSVVFISLIAYADSLQEENEQTIDTQTLPIPGLPSSIPKELSQIKDTSYPSELSPSEITAEEKRLSDQNMIEQQKSGIMENKFKQQDYLRMFLLRDKYVESLLKKYNKRKEDQTLSPFERYINKKVEEGISTKLRQFGYDLFEKYQPRIATVKTNMSNMSKSKTSYKDEETFLSESTKGGNVQGIDQGAFGGGEDNAQGEYGGGEDNGQGGSGGGNIQGNDQTEYDSSGNVQGEGDNVQSDTVGRGNVQGDSSGLSGGGDIKGTGKGSAIIKDNLDPMERYSPSANVSVGPDYVIGIADEIRIIIWGRFNYKASVTVDRAGNINLQKFGVIPVAGLTFAELKDVLNKTVSLYYKDFNLSVGMGILRSIRVFVVGNAKNPGSYDISSVSTLVSALFQSGGPSKMGSMRNIQVKRGKDTIFHFDLYDFLIKGDKSKDIRLQSEDVIFFPTIGPLVGVAGNVRIPAIYELKDEITLGDIIDMAGGITAVGYTMRLQVERIFENTSKMIRDLNLKEFTENKGFKLNDGDLVKVFKINPVLTNTITLKGNVRRPGKYEWREGLKVKDIIKDSTKETLLPETLFDYAMIERVVPPDNHMEYKDIELGRLLLDGDETKNILLMPGDVIVVFNKWDMKDKVNVEVSGAVNKPGRFQYMANMKVSDLIKLSGGLKSFANIAHAELTRTIPTQNGPEIKRFNLNLEKAMLGDIGQDIPLVQDDYLLVTAVPEWKGHLMIAVEGEVRNPGVYPIKVGERLSSVLERAGGFTDNAYLYGAVFTRNSVRDIQQQGLNAMIERLESEILAGSTSRTGGAMSADEMSAQQAVASQGQKLIESLKKLRATGRMTIKLTHPRLLKASEYDFVLESGDRLYIPGKMSTVTVMGAVMARGSYIYVDRYNFKKYISQAGGYANNADKDNIFVMRADGSAKKLNSDVSGESVKWNEDLSRWELSSFSKEYKDIAPGDIIVVPYVTESSSIWRNVKDITQILFQIATTTGILYGMHVL